jgi:hypothetical protein
VGGFDGGRRGCLCNVWLLFYRYPLVSEASRYFVESKFNYKICRYIKTYFSLYDLSLQFQSGQSRGGGEIAFWVGICNLSLFWNGNPLVLAAG